MVFARFYASARPWSRRTSSRRVKTDRASLTERSRAIIVDSMGKPHLLRIAIIALVVTFSVALGAGLLFTLRRPVVVVTDVAFDDLYGRSRAERQRKAASLRLFRRIITAEVADSAAPLAAAAAAAAASQAPACAVFPKRYEEGAKAYAQRFSGVPTVLVGDADSALAPLSPVRFSADRVTDLYRAGRVAGLLCASGGRPLLLAGADETIASFTKGLLDSGFSAEPMLLFPGAPLPSAGAFDCLIASISLRGSPAAELKGVPTVLFSWIDPDLSPADTVVVFDDSIWALLVGAVRAGREGKAGSAPSKVWFLRGSATKIPGSLGAAARARYTGHNSL